jgi:acyl-CoA thioester hydrolase
LRKQVITVSDTFPIWFPLQIRFRDLDPLAHVNNTVYLTYFEEARSFYFAQLEPWLQQWPSAEHHQEEAAQNPRIQSASHGQRYGMLVKENTCTYNLPLLRTDLAEVGVRVSHIGRTSFVMELQIRDRKEHETIFATGRTVMVWCNYHTGRPHPVPPSLRQAFSQMEGRTLP